MSFSDEISDVGLLADNLAGRFGIIIAKDYCYLFQGVLKINFVKNMVQKL